MRFAVVVVLLVALTLLLEVQRIEAVTCSPGATRICVTFDSSGRYRVDSGSGPQVNGVLTFTAGTPYTFQVVGHKFASNPFALTTSSSRAVSPITEGVKGKNPASQDGDALTFTPSQTGPGTIYYQSMQASGLGGKINILNSCAPTPTRVCIFTDTSQTPAQYMVNYGPSPLGYGLQSRGDVVLNAGTPYTFQSVGSAFASNPVTLSTSDTAPASQELRYTAGVSGTNPLAGDGQTFTYTPSRRGPSSLSYASTQSGGMGGAIAIIGACTPSLAKRHICVTHNGGTPGAYLIDTGSAEGAVEHGTLTLAADVPYTFEMTGASGVFESHPFALCDSPTGPCKAPLTDGVTGDNPGSSDNMMLTFTPAHSGTDTFYYQSLSDSDMGGKIKIINICNPSTSNICVWNDGTQFYVDQGEGPMPKGSLALKAGVPYTFELTGANFDRFPFALTTSNTGKADTTITAGVTGKNPGSADDDKLMYTPSETGFTSLYYQSPAAAGMGGSITITDSCNPSVTNICVTHDGNSPGSYTLDAGSGPVTGTLALNAGTKYTFEMQGDQFQSSPFALTLQAPVAGGTSNFQPLIDGVEGDNPASEDNHKLVYIPQEAGPTTVYYQSAASAAKGGRLHIVGACLPDKNRVCVTQSNGAYAVALGVDAVPSVRGALTLNAGEPYTFEMAGVGNVFEKQPLALSLSPSGPASAFLTANINGSNPGAGDDQKLVYTPASHGFSQLFYQSTKKGGMGGLITIANTCNPSHDNICVWHDGGMPGKYLVDQGAGPVKNGALKMYTGTEYTFEGVGAMFATRPMALSLSSTKANTPLTKNVYGDNPISKDDDKLTFIPDSSTPPTIFYNSLLYSNMGGPISVVPGPSPFKPTPHVALYSSAMGSSLSTSTAESSESSEPSDGSSSSISESDSESKSKSSPTVALEQEESDDAASAATGSASDKSLASTTGGGDETPTIETATISSSNMTNDLQVQQGDDSSSSGSSNNNNNNNSTGSESESSSTTSEPIASESSNSTDSSATPTTSTLPFLSRPTFHRTTITTSSTKTSKSSATGGGAISSSSDEESESATGGSVILVSPTVSKGDDDEPIVTKADGETEVTTTTHELLWSSTGMVIGQRNRSRTIDRDDGITTITTAVSSTGVGVGSDMPVDTAPVVIVSPFDVASSSSSSSSTGIAPQRGAATATTTTRAYPLVAVALAAFLHS